MTDELVRQTPCCPSRDKTKGGGLLLETEEEYTQLRGQRGAMNVSGCRDAPLFSSRALVCTGVRVCSL